MATSAGTVDLKQLAQSSSAIGTCIITLAQQHDKDIKALQYHDNVTHKATEHAGRDVTMVCLSLTSCAVVLGAGSRGQRGKHQGAAESYST